MIEIFSYNFSSIAADRK